MIAADAATIAKIDLIFREQDFTAVAFTAGGAGAYHALTAQPIAGTKLDYYSECLRNGVADMTNVGAAGSPSSLTEFRVYDTGTVGRVEIGADITSDGNIYRVRYLTTA